MNCALKKSEDAYWKIHIDLIRNKEFLSLLGKPHDTWKKSTNKIDPIFKKYLAQIFLTGKSALTIIIN